MTKPHHSSPSVETKFLQAQILCIRRDEPLLTWEDIAERCGKSKSYVRAIYAKALKAIIQEPAEDVIKMELSKLDDLQTEVMRVLRAFHPLVDKGEIIRDTVDDEFGQPIVDIDTGKTKTRRLEDAAPKLAAVDRALRIMERRAKFLGLDKVGNPEKEGLTPEEFAAKILGVVNAIDVSTGGAK